LFQFKKINKSLVVVLNEQKKNVKKEMFFLLIGIF